MQYPFEIIPENQGIKKVEEIRVEHIQTELKMLDNNSFRPFYSSIDGKMWGKIVFQWKVDRILGEDGSCHRP